MKTITAYQARQKFGELLETVHYREEDVVILRSGKPMAIIISPQKYEQHYQGSSSQVDRREWLESSKKTFEKVWNNTEDAQYDTYDLQKISPYQAAH